MAECAKEFGNSRSFGQYGSDNVMVVAMAIVIAWREMAGG